MCGIFGFSLDRNAITDFQRGVLATTLAGLNDKRGGHSWGILGLDDKGRHEINKGLGNMWPNSGMMAPYNMLFGHTRWATHGDKTVENSHPFDIGGIVGAHNGVIYNHHSLNTKYDRKFVVDSMHLMAHLDAGLSFDDAEGYGTVAWHEKSKPGRIYLARMRNGELCVMGIGTTKKVRGVVWSSDGDHLKEALEVAGITDVFPYQSPEGEVFFTDASRKLYCDDRHRKLELKSSVITTSWRDYNDGEDDSAAYQHYLSGHASKGNNNSHKLWNDKDPWEGNDTTQTQSKTKQDSDEELLAKLEAAGDDDAEIERLVREAARTNR